jgi:ribulose-5-phosphate 4-epimerase/fuculose-1-phosphate aldolase
MNEFRQLIADTAKDLTQKGFLSGTGGNLSLRIPGENAFAITPSNYDYLKMTAEDICVLDMHLTPLAGSRKPSIESGMHAAIYKTRPDVNAIIHTHQVYPSTLALINEPIPALFDEQVQSLGRSVEIIPYAPSGSLELAEKVSNYINGYANAYIMANHGALLLGTDMERAVNNVAVLEKCALAYLLALCTEKEIRRIPPYAREIAFDRLQKDLQKYAAQDQAAKYIKPGLHD